MRPIAFACTALALFLPNSLGAQGKTSDLQLGKSDRLIASGGPGIAALAFSPDERWLVYAAAPAKPSTFSI